MNTPVSNTVNSVAAAQPDYIAIAMVAVMALIVVYMVVRKHLTLRKSAQNSTAAAAVPIQKTECAAAPTAPGTAGEIKLHDVEPRTAAMLMAIVADTTGIPLNELRFISVREVK